MMNGLALAIYVFHLLLAPVALFAPRGAFLALLATAVFRATKIGPNALSTNQLEGLILLLVVVGLRQHLAANRFRPLDFVVCGVYLALGVVRAVQTVAYDVGWYRFLQFEFADCVRPLAFFFAAHVFLRSRGQALRVIQAACVNLSILVAIVLVEWRFRLPWRVLIGAAATTVGPAADSARFGVRLLAGPFGQWVASGSYLAILAAFTLVPFPEERRVARLGRSVLAVIGLGGAVLIGSRAPLIGTVLALGTAFGLAVLRPGGRFGWFPAAVPVVVACLAYTVSPAVRGTAQETYDHVLVSLDPLTPEGQNFRDRTDLARLLRQYSWRVPAIGYGLTVVRNPEQVNLPVFYSDLDVNFFDSSWYDVGLGLASLWTFVLLLAALAACRYWLIWPASARWAPCLVVTMSVALLPVLASNGWFTAQLSEWWLLVVALMTFTDGRLREPVRAVQARTRATRKSTSGPPVTGRVGPSAAIAQ